MNTTNQDNQSNAHVDASDGPAGAQTASAATHIPARQRYVHLYMPVITAALIVTNGPILAGLVRSGSYPGQNEMLLVAASGIPTYLFGSFFYPAMRPPPTPEESIRFTRKSDLYRALVLLTYGRIFGTPFNLQFYITDLVFSYAVDYVIGDRPVGEPQRRSEFLITLLWVGGNWLALSVVPANMATLYFILGAFDRTIWRAAYLALVDDIVKVLTRPNVQSLTGKLTLVFVQSFTITSLVYFALSWIKRLSATG